MTRAAPPRKLVIRPCVLCAAAAGTYPPAVSNKRDYYEVLGVERGADDAALKAAYRKLARAHHPDRNQGNAESESLFKEASEAYRVLADAEARRRYDRFGHAAFEGQGPGGFDPTDFGSVGDLLEGLLGEVFGGGRRRKKTSGRDLKYELSVDFEEAALGADKQITIRKPVACDECAGTGAKPGTSVRKCPTCEGRGEVKFQRRLFAATRTCATCKGSGKKVESPCAKCDGSGATVGDAEMTVHIPAGVEDGAVRTVRGAGELAAGGAGDLHITIRIAEHPLFKRQGADVLCTVPVSFPQAVLGTDLEVPTLEGRVTMKLPPGTQSGKVFRLRGKGIPAYGGVGKGDELVTIMVEVPDSVSRQQRKLIEELASEMGTETHPHQRGFLEKLKDLF